ncbi:MAG: hypothetical protein IJ003_05335 [Candidatus Gastranaerophilales bacterium]|nr:hypothetical protein [Candidatus Gastranaerophilales bacterium]
MIPPLKSNVSFTSSKMVSARQAYKDKIADNMKMAEKQTNNISAMVNPLNAQIPMNGQGANLNIIA